MTGNEGVVSSSRQNVLLVTGSSRGIGAAIVRLAALHSYAVCFTYVQNEIANAVLWLFSHDASYVTGTALHVSGGLQQQYTSNTQPNCFANSTQRGVY